MSKINGHSIIDTTPELELPFKPFTLDEVKAITGITSKTLDTWIKTILPLRLGDDQLTRGLDDAQTFAVYVGKRFLDEGCPPLRATAIVSYIASRAFADMQAEINAGRNFPVTKACGAPNNCLVPTPDSVLGRRLRLDKLIEEYRHHMDRVFPKG